MNRNEEVIYAANQSSVRHDHDYVRVRNLSTPLQEVSPGKSIEGSSKSYSTTIMYALMLLQYQELESSTHGQHKSDRWYHESKLCVTASEIKEICHQYNMHGICQKKILLTNDQYPSNKSWMKT